MRLSQRGFNLRSNRVPLSRVFLILIGFGLLSGFLQACSPSTETQVEQNIESSAPLTTSGGKLMVEGSSTDEVNSAIQCDGEVDENGATKPGTTTTPDTSDDCSTISGVPYFQPDPESAGSGTILYRESPGSNVIVVHDHYTPSPSFWYFGGSSRTVIMPSSMMYSGGQPVFQGSRAVLSSTPNTPTVARTPIITSNGKPSVTPLKSTASFVAPITNTPISGGKLTQSHISSSSAKVSAPSSSFSSSTKSVPSRSSVRASVSRGVSVGSSHSSAG